MEYILILIIGTLGGGISQTSTVFTDKQSCESARQFIITDLRSQTDKVFGNSYTIANTKTYCLPKTQ